MVETIQWVDGAVVMIDQRRLPLEETYATCRTYEEVAAAIRDMVIRGAPAIGVAAAMGVALGVLDAPEENLDRQFETICETLAATRPTAVNLFWAIDRMKRLYASLRGRPVDEIRRRLVEEALLVRQEDIAICRAIGRNGASLVPDGKTVLTHCNAGALATAGYGTALGVVRAAIESGKSVDVFADETRPFLQGARLTVWELQQDGIPATLITDNMAGHFLHSGRIGCVVVGADRIAANGDVANKVGTYSVAVLAKENNVPFFVAAPISTLDLTLSFGRGNSHRTTRRRRGDACFRPPGGPDRHCRPESGVRRDAGALRHRDHHRKRCGVCSVRGILETAGRVGPQLLRLCAG